MGTGFFDSISSTPLLGTLINFMTDDADDASPSEKMLGRGASSREDSDTELAEGELARERAREREQRRREISYRRERATRDSSSREVFTEKPITPLGIKVAHHKKSPRKKDEALINQMAGKASAEEGLELRSQVMDESDEDALGRRQGHEDGEFKVPHKIRENPLELYSFLKETKR